MLSPPPTPGPKDQVEVAGLMFDNITEAECVRRVIESAAMGKGGWVVTPNADIAQQCRKNPRLRALIRDATITVADGMPIIWASRLSGNPLIERVCGSDLVWTLAEGAAAHHLSVFLLGGGTRDTATNAGELLIERNPGLQIAGTYYPPFGFENDPAEIAAIEASIDQARPDIVYVALGFPKAEKLIAVLREKHPKTWWIGIGISLSFICGEVRRAPPWMQSIGLEWFHRLTQEPKRLFGRYLIDDLPFVIALLSRSLVQRLRQPSNG